MTKQVKNLRKIMFITSLAVVLIIVFASAQTGQGQDKEYMSDYQVFQTAESNLRQNNLSQALAGYQQLLQKPRYQDSVTITFDMGQTLKYSGDLNGAKEYYEKTKTLYPAVVTVSSFLKEYGEMLKTLGDPKSSHYLVK